MHSSSKYSAKRKILEFSIEEALKKKQLLEPDDSEHDAIMEDLYEKLACLLKYRYYVQSSPDLENLVILTIVPRITYNRPQIL